MNDLRFTLWEMLSLVGVLQCVYILVYIIFRVDNVRQVILPLLYFFTLGAAFFLDFAKSYIGTITPFYDFWVWTAWSFGLPLSVLLIIQIAQLSKLPSLPIWSVLILTPLALVFSLVMARDSGNQACGLQRLCSDLAEWLRISGLVGGAASLLVIWSQRNLLENLQTQKAGQERYWLIIALIMLNIGSLILIAAAGGFNLAPPVGMVRTVLGLAFIYLVTTSLFRIYPQALVLAPLKKTNILTSEEEALALKIRSLIALDKVYHEATYSRADLARELKTSEATISKVINHHFKKSLPQLLNEQRVEDAKRLLHDTSVNIKIIAQEVGFNSIPSFNRVFKELEGISPSDFRKKNIKK